MDFNITTKSKKKARKNRIRYERKWTLLKTLSFVFACIAIFSFVVGIFFVSNNDYKRLELFGVLFAVFFILSIVSKAIIQNIASHWIQDRLNERLWIEDNVLYHFQQVAFAAGLNSRSADSTGYLFAFQLNSIRGIVYDEKSKRIEFLADGKGYHYSDVRRRIIDKEWPLNGYEAVFYDYFEPSLIETLKNNGLDVEIKELNDFSIFDNSI